MVAEHAPATAAAAELQKEKTQQKYEKQEQKVVVR